MPTRDQSSSSSMIRNGHEPNDNNGEGPSSKRLKQTINKLACSRCRSLKARCELQDPPNGKCTRCTRLSYDCVWVETKKRGRRANSVRQQDQSMIDDSSTMTMNANFAHQLDEEQKDPSSESLDRLGIAALSESSIPTGISNIPVFVSNPSPHQSLPETALFSPRQLRSRQQQIPLNENSPADPSPRSIGGTSQRSLNHNGSLKEDTSPQSALPSLSMIDLAQAKEKALQDLQDLNAAPRVAPRLQKEIKVDILPEADPIDMHVLSELDARQLFDHYHQKMNAFIILLDPFLHTVEYVRKTSPTLFSTILAVSAKFIRPQLYDSLLMHARQLVGRGIIDGKVSIGLIQSLLIQVYWKKPDDTSAWLRVGEAIRLGYQLHLHRNRSEPLPIDEFEARLILDRERTWIDLCAFDQTFFLQSAEEEDGFHQTYMIAHFRINVQDWLKETKEYGVQDDLEQGANFEWIKMQRLSRDIYRARPGNARALGQHVQGTLEAAYERYLNPKSIDAFKYETRPWIRVNFWLAAASLALAKAKLTAIGIEGHLLAEWVVASSAFVDAFEIVAKHDYIRYWQDTLGITLYSMGEFSVKIFHDVYPATQKSIVGWMERIYRACELCTDGETESTAAFISRFFQLCLRAVCLRPHTPDLSENINKSIEFQAMQSGQQRSQSIPWLSTNQAPSTIFHDASYWESIFPGVSNDWSWLFQSLQNEIPVEHDS